VIYSDIRRYRPTAIYSDIQQYTADKAAARGADKDEVECAIGLEMAEAYTTAISSQNGNPHLPLTIISQHY